LKPLYFGKRPHKKGVFFTKHPFEAICFRLKSFQKGLFNAFYAKNYFGRLRKLRFASRDSFQIVNCSASNI
jgi:hypothetical protein